MRKAVRCDQGWGAKPDTTAQQPKKQNQNVHFYVEEETDAYYRANAERWLVELKNISPKGA
jgi:hypothetical protein